MMDKKLLVNLIKFATNADKGYFELAHIVACYLDKNLHVQLEQLINGPIHDGDIICKADRDILLSLGLAIRVCVEGEQGYTAATYFSYTVYKKIVAIKNGDIVA